MADMARKKMMVRALLNAVISLNEDDERAALKQVRFVMEEMEHPIALSEESVDLHPEAIRMGINDGQERPVRFDSSKHWPISDQALKDAGYLDANGEKVEARSLLDRLADYPKVPLADGNDLEECNEAD